MQVVSTDPDLNGRTLLTSTAGIGYIYANSVGLLPAYATWTSTYAIVFQGSYIEGFLGNWYNVNLLGYLTTAVTPTDGFTVDTNSCLLSFDDQRDWIICKGTLSWPVMAPGESDLACLNPVNVQLRLV